eukprot:scaffold5789_cov159-Pinguiococcus_pyrenoidosus.AAC.1
MDATHVFESAFSRGRHVGLSTAKSMTRSDTAGSREAPRGMAPERIATAGAAVSACIEVGFACNGVRIPTVASRRAS